ncbi:hypothetical protein KEJ34_06915 [Candidatus Bathyarchaeota archaeon]|nr:hypothetical protein [Candidatus Bathyarchaeota archaeon]
MIMGITRRVLWLIKIVGCGFIIRCWVQGLKVCREAEEDANLYVNVASNELVVCNNGEPFPLRRIYL